MIASPLRYKTMENQDQNPPMTPHSDASDFVRAFPWRACAFTTLTGLDDAVDLAEVARISSAHPGRVEWGVLLGNGEGARYPTRERISALVALRQDQPDVRLALHLCGKYALRWIADDAEVVALAAQFDRIQLNVNGNDSRLDKDALLAALVDGRHPAVITQHNTNNQALTAFLGDAPNHALLFDASGGRGVAPTDWPLPVDGKVCGYAGGLGPGVIDRQLRRIASLANGPFWIDMEAALRTPDDQIDLDSCERVLEEVDAWRASLAADLERFLTQPPPSTPPDPA